MIKVKHVRDDPGNSRVYYRSIVLKSRLLLCTQPDHNGNTEWYVCTKDGEPSHILTNTTEIVTK